MIYRNSLLANYLTWTRDDTPGAPEVARRFLHGECQLLRLVGVAETTIRDLEAFLAIADTMPITIKRSNAGSLLVRADDASEDLLITGKTADVLRAYIDREPVRTEDRLDMTLRRAVAP